MVLRQLERNTDASRVAHQLVDPQIAVGALDVGSEGAKLLAVFHVLPDEKRRHGDQALACLYHSRILAQRLDVALRGVRVAALALELGSLLETLGGARAATQSQRQQEQSPARTPPTRSPRPTRQVFPERCTVWFQSSIVHD